MATVVKEMLVRDISRCTGVRPYKVRKAIEAVLAYWKKGLAAGEIVELPAVGEVRMAFRRTRKARLHKLKGKYRINWLKTSRVLTYRELFRDLD